jgi:hypothetical protein
MESKCEKSTRDEEGRELTRSRLKDKAGIQRPSEST